MSIRAKLCISAVVLGAWLTVGSLPIFAAVPDSISYQGILKTPGGSPVPDGNYNVTFRIYDVASGPSPALWTESKSVSTTGGVFTTLLGSVTALPPSIISGPNRFLGITVSPDPEMMPRTAIVAVPYAYRIATVDGAAGGSISGDVSVSVGNLDLDPSTLTSGNILKSGVPFIHDFGSQNTFIGRNAGNLTMSGPGNNTGSGYNTLFNNTTGFSNTASGSGALASNTTGIENTASGVDALFNNTTGYFNMATGAYSLKSNTTGNENTAGGSYALYGNTTGDNNTASGSYALFSNTTGFSNTASGALALRNNTTASGNTADGAVALFHNTTGYENTASGVAALYSNTTGGSNTASGAHALYSNTTGSNNTAIGDSTLFYNSTGYNNTAGGASALRSNTTGYSVTASGADALRSNTTGYNNTASGATALYSNTAGSANTASGLGALYSNTTGYENTADGMEALHSNTTGYNNTASGIYALFNTTTGNHNTAAGYGALYTNATGSNNTALGYNADIATGNLTNAAAIGAGAIVNASNKIRLGNGSVTVIEGQVAYTFTSDSTRKENFRPVNGEDVLRKIREFNLRSWNYVGNDPEQFRHYGPMAQEFFAAFGHDGVGTSGTPTTINSGDEAGILMIAIQALEKRTEEVEGLKAQIAELREMIRAQASKQK